MSSTQVNGLRTSFEPWFDESTRSLSTQPDAFQRFTHSPTARRSMHLGSVLLNGRPSGGASKQAHVLHGLTVQAGEQCLAHLPVVGRRRDLGHARG